MSVDNFISLLSTTEKDLMISSLLGKQYEGSDWDRTFSQNTFVSSVLNFRYHFGRSGSTSKPLAANIPMPFNDISSYLKTKSVTRMRTFYLLLLTLPLQPTMGFSLLGDFLPFRPFLAQFSPPSYSHRLDIFLNVFNPSFLWSSSDSPTHWLPI